jgi:hypothetical protein
MEGVRTPMFSKAQVDSILNQLTQEWHTDPSWEQLLRDVYVGMARGDAGVALGGLDPRVIKIIQEYQR